MAYSLCYPAGSLHCYGRFACFRAGLTGHWVLARCVGIVQSANLVGCQLHLEEREVRYAAVEGLVCTAVRGAAEGDGAIQQNRSAATNL